MEDRLPWTMLVRALVRGRLKVREKRRCCPAGFEDEGKAP